MEMYDCPKFESCSAPICPLLPSVSSGYMCNGERVCLYLTEYQKADSEARFRVLGLGELYQDMAIAMEEINSSPNTDRYQIRALKMAANSSSRIAKGMKLKAESQNG